MDYKEMVDNLEQVRHTLRRLMFTPKVVSLEECQTAWQNLDEAVAELNEARQNGLD